MILWHILSRDRLEQKIEFAAANNGRLLLTVPNSSQDIASGALGPDLYCLSHLVGGVLFSAADSLRAIKIQIRPEARVYVHVGDPDHIP